MVSSEADHLRQSASGFHLEEEERRPRASSVSSHYKQKIDALFDDTRSITSLSHCGSHFSELGRRDSKVSSIQDAKKTIYEDENPYCRKHHKLNNVVQDRIERMFADMPEQPRTPKENIGVHIFNVHYLGSTPLHSKVTSLSGLQTPLKDLYFTYRRNYRNKSLNGRLEISKSGLKVRYKGEKGESEQTNPFSTIAVWSAVKFLVQEEDGNELSYAFVPLITDPDNIDRHALFKTLESSDKKYILSNNENSHSPIFAVVMRKIGVAKQLECHGFVCQTTEDAIVIAATLYKSLMSHMSKQSQPDKKTFKNRNGVSCMSIASSSVSPRDAPARPPRKARSSSSLSGDSDRADGFSTTESYVEKPKVDRNKKISSETRPPPPPPPPAPSNESKRITVEEVKAKLDSITHDTSGSDTQRSKKSTSRESKSSTKERPPKSQHNTRSSTKSKVSEKIELFRELERRKNLQRPPTMPPPIPIKPPSEPPPDPPAKDPLRRNHSGRQSLSESGDILTKVAIPRSGSFLNAGGLTRYKSLGHRNNGKKGGGSPLGFNELFNEFKVQEDLHSMDDILNAIIDAEGMSFNDLKPIYKEFLLKLAVTLTKDEIFQHSKAIMKKQKKKILRRNSIFQNKRRKIFKGANGLRMVFRLPFGKDLRRKEKKKHQSSFEFRTMPTTKENATESSVSTSSYDLRQFRPKDPPLPPPKRAVKQRSSKRSEKVVHVSKRNGKVSKPGERTSASEDSDFLTLSNRLGCQNRNSSSGYVSCSECESEGCVDRCYCSLKVDCKDKCYCSPTDLKRASSKTKLLARNKNCKDCINREVYDADFSYCSCDSESCADSNKCYCAAPRRTGTAVQSSRSLEYLQSPSQQLYSERLRRVFDDHYGSSKRSKSRANAVSLRRREERSRRARSSDNLTLDYELLLQNKARDTSRNMKRLTVRSTGAGSQDALSVKKSAEMAALFADVRLSQRTDVRALSAARARPAPPLARMFDRRPLSRNASLEDTLGYLP